MRRKPILSGLLAALILNLTIIPCVAAAIADKEETIGQSTDSASLRQLGLQKFSNGKYKAAERYLKGALALLQSDPKRASEYNSTLEELAGVRQARGHYWQAYYDYKEMLGKSHTMDLNRAIVLENVGRLNYLLGNMPQASDELQESVAIFARTSAPSINEAHALIDLSQVSSELEQFDRAKDAGEKALTISQKLTGENSLDVCRSLNALAKTALFACRPQEAEGFLSRAISIPVGKSRQEALLYSDCLNTCALTYLDESRVQEAKVFGQKALGIREQMCGERHPLTGESLATLGVVSLCLKDYIGAKSLLDRSLSIFEHSLGEENREVAKICLAEGTAALLVHSSDEASAYFRRALSISNKLAGTNDPQVARINSLAGAYFWQSSNFLTVMQIKMKESFARSFSKTPADPLFRSLNALIVKGPEAVVQHLFASDKKPNIFEIDIKNILFVILVPIAVVLYITFNGDGLPALGLGQKLEGGGSSAWGGGAQDSFNAVSKGSSSTVREIQVRRRHLNL